MGTASPIELIVAVQVLIGVGIALAEVIDGGRRRRLFERAGINGVRHRYATMRTRQEWAWLAVQLLILLTAVIALLLPPLPPEARRIGTARLLAQVAVAAMAVAEVVLVAAALRGRANRRELLEMLRKLEEER